MSDFFFFFGFFFVSMIFGAILGLSVYLPLMAGQLSLATPGFYALGGYIAAILSTSVFKFTGNLFPIPYLLLEMLLAAGAAGGGAGARGGPGRRGRGSGGA